MHCSQLQHPSAYILTHMRTENFMKNITSWCCPNNNIQGAIHEYKTYKRINKISLANLANPLIHQLVNTICLLTP